MERIQPFPTEHEWWKFQVLWCPFSSWGSSFGCPLAGNFYHEWVLILVKYSFCICLVDSIFLPLYSVTWWIILIHFQMIAQTCFSQIKNYLVFTLLLLHITLFYFICCFTSFTYKSGFRFKISVKNFCVYVHEVWICRVILSCYNSALGIMVLISSNNVVSNVLYFLSIYVSSIYSQNI